MSETEYEQDETYMTPKEVASLFRVETKTVTRWANQGKIDYVKTMGGHRRYPRSQVMNYLAGGGDE